MLKVKGHEIQPPNIRDSFFRRAVKLHNNIISLLKALGVDEDDIEVTLENAAMKKLPASVEWYLEGHNCLFSCSSQPKFVENLYVIHKVLEIEMQRIVDDEITLNDFAMLFSEDEDVDKQRIEARKLLGVAEDEMDFNVITKKYKLLAKNAHPDMPDGDHEKFQALNKAHKLLKRELD